LDDNCPACLIGLSVALDAHAASEAGTASLAAGCRLGDYELLGEIARGGMGVVYRARQLSLNRLVAVKVLPGGQQAQASYIKRFRREAEAAASLNHPNIVAIHEVGEHDGQLFFSMALIEGRSLAELIRDRPLPARQAAQLLRTIATAIAFAHGRRVLHRDLKPSNVVLDNLGAPHITDFGLAKRADADGNLTVTDEVLGSPNYMAPEQADPDLGPTTPASDLYSLGAMLYHLLVGRPPFLAETVPQTLRLAAEGGPVSPHLLNPEVPRDLETICLKCLETDPRHRYASAQEMADELDRFLRNEPIRARPIGAMAKTGRWCRRKPALASAIGVVASLVLVVAIGSPLALVRIQREREVSESARRQEAASRRRAQAAEQEAKEQLYTALVEQAHASVRSGEIGQRLRALDAIRRAAAISNTVELRREALSALALPDLRFEREWPAGAEFTVKLLDPSFANVAVCRGNGPVEIRATSDWGLRATLPASTNLPAYNAWWSADGRFLAVKRDCAPGGERSDLEVWDVPAENRVLLLHDLANRAMAFHPHRHQFLLAQLDGRASVWDVEQGKETAQFRFRLAPMALKYSPDGERFAVSLASASRFAVSVHDARTGESRVEHDFASPVLDLDWHPNGRGLATAEHGGTVGWMDAQTGKTRSLGAHQAQAVRVVFSPDGDYMLSGGWEGELICWDGHTGRRGFIIDRRSWTAQFRSDGRQCALITPSGIQLHVLERPLPRTFAEDLGPRLRHASFSPDGRWLAASAERSLGVWDLLSRAPGAVTMEIAEARPAFTADGAQLFASASGAKCAGWRIARDPNGRAAPVLQSLSVPAPTGFASLAVISNAIAFTGSSGSGIVGVENLAAGEIPWLPTARGINGVSPDGRWLGVYASYSTRLSIYGLPEMTPVVTLTNRGSIRDFAFSPDGDEVAVSSRGGVEFWSTRDWSRTRVLTNFTGILYAPESSTCWLTRDFRTAGLYDARTLNLKLPLPSGTLPMALSADGRRLAVSVDARGLQVWDLDEVWSQLGELGLVEGLSRCQVTASEPPLE
jgi:WD40 repeat protein